MERRDQQPHYHSVSSSTFTAEIWILCLQGRKKKAETPVVGLGGEATGSPWQANCITQPHTRCDVIYNRVSHTPVCVTQSWLVWGECLAQGPSANRFFSRHTLHECCREPRDAPRGPGSISPSNSCLAQTDSDRWFMGLCIALDRASAYRDPEIWNGSTLCHTAKDDDITEDVFLAAEYLFN